ncbi:MAG: DUF2934 domain-containing protein, partial [Acidobacteriota bacterium]
MKPLSHPSTDIAPAPDGGLDPGSRLARIARRAHELFEGRGAAHGLKLDDWLQAEREIDSAGP